MPSWRAQELSRLAQQRSGANLILRRCALLSSSHPRLVASFNPCHRPDTTVCRETPSRVWSLTPATESLDEARYGGRTTSRRVFKAWKERRVVIDPDIRRENLRQVRFYLNAVLVSDHGYMQANETA